MMKCFLKSIAITTLFALFFTSNLAFAALDSTNVAQRVIGVCNENGICEADIGETVDNCSADCGCNNNGVCESGRGEITANCPLDCPAIVITPPGGALPLADTTPPVIFNLLISEITLKSVIISWDTNEQALCQLFWGRTPEYKEEAISETAFYRKHATKIINLSPATTYHFKIVCRDTSKNEAETTDQQFTTLSPPDITPPANVSNFTAIPGDRQITLTWENPPDLDFKAVKIMRSEKFYPSDPWEGVPVYNDKGTSFIDKDLTNGVRYYYTAFAYDRAGNYASGAIVSAIPQAVPPVVPPPPIVPPPIVPPPPEIEKITFKDFDFVQDGKKILLKEEKIIEAKAEEPLTISLKYEKVPEVLKTIMVTLEKGNKFFSFLLRVNKEKTIYETTFLIPEEPGVYPLTISILDYKNQTLKQIKGELWVMGKPKPLPPPKICWYKKPCFWEWLLVLLFLILLAIAIKKFWEEIKKKEPKKELKKCPTELAKISPPGQLEIQVKAPAQDKPVLNGGQPQVGKNQNEGQKEG